MTPGMHRLELSNSPPTRQDFAGILDAFLRDPVTDLDAVISIYERSAELIETTDWQEAAHKLKRNEAISARWLASALFEAGSDFSAASEVLNSFSCVPARSLEAFRLIALSRSVAKLGNISGAVVLLRRAIRLSDSSRLLRACKKVLTLLKRSAAIDYARSARVAILGNATFDFFIPVLETVAFGSGIHLLLFGGAYDQHVQEVLSKNSSLHAFDPQIIIIATDWRSLALPEESENPREAINERIKQITGIWDGIATQFRCHVIQHNFVIPEATAYGGLSSAIPGGRASIIRALNSELLQAAQSRPEISILDVEQISSIIGKQTWDDDRLWIAAKQYPSAEAAGFLAKHQVALIRAILGMTSKCLVLDLDNVIWGGIIGEDGLDGIRLGGSPEGEAFVAFQRYLKALRGRGILLAVCSKNNEADAKAPFEKHPEMVLRLQDISAFIANWAPKSDNLKVISRQLNIGSDSLVFIDDNPVEREEVRKAMPDVEVPELPTDPALYQQALYRELLFETVSLTSEDKKRAQSYQDDLNRRGLRESSESLQEFLAGLQMRIELKPFDAPNLPRIVQLLNKTNQFNLTTCRLTSEEVIAFVESPGNYTQFMNLRDRFGESGITGILMASSHEEALNIDVWLMSCRVLGRQAEHAMLAAVWRFARHAGYRSLRGVYQPTAKNQQVADLYDRMGFQLVSSGDDGRRHYQLALDSDPDFPEVAEICDLTSGAVQGELATCLPNLEE